MTELKKEHFLRWATFVALAVVLVGGICMIYPLYLRGQALKEEEAELQERIRMKHLEIAQLSEYQQRFRTDPEFVELIARQNRRVYPGELVFIFQD